MNFEDEVIENEHVFYVAPAEDYEEPTAEHYYYKVGEVITLGTEGGFFHLDNEFRVHEEGILVKPENIIIQGYWNHGVIDGELIISDIFSQCIMGVYTIQNNVVLSVKDLSNIQSDQEIAYEDQKWKGQVLDNEPFGWGDLYSNDGKMVYSGYMIANKRVCFGTVYNFEGDDYYQGTIYNNIPFGAGKIVDTNGKRLYDGGMYNGTNTYSGVLEIYKNNWEEICYHSLLEEIYIYDFCYEDVRTFTISGFTFLRVLTIGSSCFRRLNINIKSRDSSSRAFFLNCPYLETITIGNDSFVEYCVCEFRGLPSLKKLSIGDKDNSVGCFINCFELLLEGISFEKTNM